MFETVRSGFLAAGLAIGSATGLFSVMGKAGGPKTSQEIADLAGLKERYVREWLGAMVTGRIVHIDKDNETYYLTPSRVEVLCNKKGLENIGVMAESLPLLLEVYQDILQCATTEGPRGLSYEKYIRYHSWQDKFSSERYRDTPPSFITSEKEIKEMLESGGKVCDIGCGQGAATCILARTFPKTEFHGVDFSESALAEAKSRAKAMSLDNVTFHHRDATKLSSDWTSTFDLVYAVDSIHDQARPDLSLEEISRVLKTGGYFIMMEDDSHTKHADNIDNAMAPISYIFSLLHCMPVSLFFEGGMGLGAMWGQEKAIEMMSTVNLECVSSSVNSGERVFVSKKKEK
ncbi:S-adenosylmethionine-dependent methyltransferase Rv2258c-like [Glandiceps talaboti]